MPYVPCARWREVVALSDDENIIFVARREPPGLAQLFSDI